MKKNILLLVCAVFLSLSQAFAANVSATDAQTVAVNFFKVTYPGSHLNNLTAVLRYTKTETDGTVDFYAYDMSPAKGFVIISATDNDVPIIGYSNESYFPTDFSTIGLKEWLGRWSEELHYVILNNMIATPRAAPKWAAYRATVAPVSEKTTSVAPFCLTTWDQNTEYSSGPNLYNNYCPGTGTQQAVTGCVATAMSQIMKFWAYPTIGLNSSSYNDATSAGYSKNYGVLSCNYADSTFLWATMPLTLTNTSTTAQINAIGSIMRATGVSVAMDYSPDGSGAYVLSAESGNGASAQYSYVHYFGYQSVIKGITMSSSGSNSNTNPLSNTLFIDTLEAELNAGRLVQVDGDDQNNGGHTWVCDGYNTNNQFHMNWGWSGYANGYFAVTSLNPNDGTQLSFTEDIGALIHILPPAPTNTTTVSVHAAASSAAVCPGTTTSLSAHTATASNSITYAWTPTTGLACSTCATTVATPTATTTYTVTADSAGIYGSTTLTVTVRPAVTATVGTATSPSCYGGTNGTATATANAGTSGYTYLWSTGATTAVASNLSAATYTVTITDAANCTATATKTVTQPTALVVAATPTNASCGQANGHIAATVTGGTSGYTYLWSTGATTTSATGLAAATYRVTITDAHSCSTSASATIASSGSLSLTAAATNVSCYGNANGAASVTVTGNTGTVTYHWSNGSTTAAISNVPAATYTVTITDGGGCSATASKAITQPTALSASVSATPTSCGGGATGSATITAAGGTSGYSYHWSNGGTAATATGLTAGAYPVTITDAHSCTTTASAVITASGALGISTSATTINCYGNTTGSASATTTGATGTVHYAWSNGATTAAITNVGANTYTVTVTDGGGCSVTSSQTITQPAAVTAFVSVVNAQCGGVNGNASATATGGTGNYSYVWSTGATTANIANLAAGSYSLSVSDANHCSVVSTAIVAAGTPITAQAATTAPSCYGENNGTAVITTANGTAPYNFVWSNGASSSSVGNLAAGNYAVTITDANNCTTTTNIAITQPNQIQVTLGVTEATGAGNNGVATVSNIAGAIAPFSYVWSNGGTTQTISGLAPGTYSVVITDAHGCTQSAIEVVSFTTGINNLSNGVAFTVYPNPAHSQVTVQVEQLNSGTSLSVKNILGQVIIAQTVASQQTQLDLSSFANGVYLIEVRQGEKTAIKQLIIAR